MRTILIAALVGGLAAPAIAQAADGQPHASPLTQTVFAAITKVCLPLVEGQDLASVKATSGLAEADGARVLAVEGAPPLELRLPNPINPNTCEITLPTQAAGDVKQAIDDWSEAPANFRKVRDREPQATALGPRLVTTWIAQGDGRRIVMVVSQPETPADREAAASLVLQVERG